MKMKRIVYYFIILALIFLFSPNNALALYRVKPQEDGIHVFLYPGQKLDVPVVFRAGNNEENVVWEEQGFENRNMVIPAKIKFVDPNCPKTFLFSLKPREEMQIAIPINAGQFVSPGTYPRKFVFKSTSDVYSAGGAGMTRTRVEYQQVLIIFVNVIGGDGVKEALRATMTHSLLPKKILFSFEIINEENFYGVAKNAMIVMETDNSIVASSPVTISWDKGGKGAYIYSMETNNFQGQIDTPLLARKDYTIKLMFDWHGLKGNIGRFEFQKFKVVKKFPFKFTKEMQKDVWGELAHFALSNPDAEEIYAFANNGSSDSKWKVKNKTPDPLTIRVKSQPDNWEIKIPSQFNLGPDEDYDFEIGVFNPEGVLRLEGYLTFEAFANPDSNEKVGLPIVKEIIMRGDF